MHIHNNLMHIHFQEKDKYSRLCCKTIGRDRLFKDCTAQLFHNTETVKEDMNYTQSINSMPVTLVEFYATWCPHCRNMMPVVAQVKEQLDGKAAIVQIDVDKNQETADNAGVEVYPTFILYKDGKEVWRNRGEISGKDLQAEITSRL